MEVVVENGDAEGGGGLSEKNPASKEKHEAEMKIEQYQNDR